MEKMKKVLITGAAGYIGSREYDSPKVWGNPERINRIMGAK